MAENLKVVYEFSEKGLQAIKKQVEDLRQVLGESGVDARTYEKNLSGIEKQLTKTTSAAKDLGKENQNIIAQRYALYDLSRTYATIGAALAGVGIYATVMAAQYESAFTTVERTLNPAEAAALGVDNIRQSLIGLSTQIPLTFAEVAKIAQLGNQLGVEARNIAEFTEVVAQFSAVTGISVEQTALTFGQLGNLLGVSAENYRNLGSAIALVGVNSAATEQQIISIARELAPSARAAGFTADAVIGLSGALGSIRVPPERSRSTILQFFETLNMAVARGGTDLQNFATVVGVTAAELEDMVRSGQGESIFRRFIDSAATADTVEITKALDALGLAGLRVNPTIRALADNTALMDQTFADAATGLRSVDELSRQYALVLDDLNSQWQIFQNNMNALVVAMTGGIIPGMSALLQVVNGVLTAFLSLVNDVPIIGWVVGFIGVVVTILGLMTLFRAGIIAAQASLYALKYIIDQTTGSGAVAIGTFRGFGQTLREVGASANFAAGGVFTLRAAIRSLLTATGVGVLAVILGMVADNIIGAVDPANELNDMVESIGEKSGGAFDLAKGIDKVGGSASKAAKEVRTLVDYANDLAGVFGRSFDLRFGSVSAMDEITLKWIELNEEMDEYERKVRSLTADRALQEYWLSIAELYDDQVRAAQIRENIAKIDDELAKAQAGASTELQGQSKAAIENRKTMRDLLTSYEDYLEVLAASGASQAELEAVIAQLDSEFKNQAEQLGFNSLELQEYGYRFRDLETIVNRLPRRVDIEFNGDPALTALEEFFAKAKAAAGAGGAGAGGAFGDGFLDELPTYDDVRGRRSSGGEFGRQWWDEWITSWADGSLKWIPILGTWLTAIGQWWEDGGREWAFDSLRGIQDGMGEIDWAYEITKILLPPLALAGNLFFNWGKTAADEIGRGMASRPIRVSSPSSLGGVSDIRFFASGGYTGRGHWQAPAGIVHRGEYVVPKKHVNQSTGLPDLNYIQSLQRAKPATGPGYANGGFVGGGGMSGPIELGPASLHFLRGSMNVDLKVDGRALASAASAGDSRLARTGSN